MKCKCFELFGLCGTPTFVKPIGSCFSQLHFTSMCIAIRLEARALVCNSCSHYARVCAAEVHS